MQTASSKVLACEFSCFGLFKIAALGSSGFSFVTLIKLGTNVLEKNFFFFKDFFF